MERPFQGLLTQTSVSPGNRSHGHFWPATGRFRPPPIPYAEVRTSSIMTRPMPASPRPSGARNTPAHARLTRRAWRARRQSIEHADRKLASRRSSLVLRL